MSAEKLRLPVRFVEPVEEQKDKLAGTCCTFTFFTAVLSHRAFLTYRPRTGGGGGGSSLAQTLSGKSRRQGLALSIFVPTHFSKIIICCLFVVFCSVFSALSVGQKGGAVARALSCRNTFSTKVGHSQARHRRRRANFGTDEMNSAPV